MGEEKYLKLDNFRRKSHDLVSVIRLEATLSILKALPSPSSNCICLKFFDFTAKK